MDDEIIDEEQLKVYAIICTLANTAKLNSKELSLPGLLGLKVNKQPKK